jgi:hypothetical protein
MWLLLSADHRLLVGEPPPSGRQPTPLPVCFSIRLHLSSMCCSKNGTWLRWGIENVSGDQIRNNSKHNSETKDKMSNAPAMDHARQWLHKQTRIFFRIPNTHDAYVHRQLETAPITEKKTVHGPHTHYARRRSPQRTKAQHTKVLPWDAQMSENVNLNVKIVRLRTWLRVN